MRPKIGDEFNPKIYSRKLLTSKFKKRSGNESCDASFCSKLQPQLEKKIDMLLKADPTIEENSIKGYAKKDSIKNTPPKISNDEVKKIINLLDHCEKGQRVEKVLSYICPQLFEGIEVANGFINSGKQFSIRLNNDYTIRIFYNEIENMTTEFISGNINKEST